MSPIRVLLVDDQPMIRMGFRLILESEPDIEVVGESADGLSAVEDATALRPGIILMDIRMSQMDGVEATRRIVESGSSSRIIILTTFDLDAHVAEALRAGASGFLVKDGPAESLVGAIRTVAAGDAVLSPRVTRKLLDRLAPLTDIEKRIPTSLSALTAREVDVLLEVARGGSNAEIAEKLAVSETTVKTHLGNIFDKYKLRSRVHAIILAYDTGLVSPQK